ncbi:pleckstrin homology domain-containing family O member 2 [Nematolebias whitei]|uniref:pleckstrin homology domain-containing family O member 2 n=1 Tax=Nematolebias whitei TaxID=451745 RepID=UPI0018979BA3|nr:pleckstrin homology domain-containing family O member 2 [Nematolebias whitei]
MEDGTKEDTAQHKKPKFLSKAGWVKKAHGKLLTSYKDRYVHVEKTEVVVYEHEDLQNCLERFDLENYESCHELKSPFKKKHRLVLIRSPKPGNKVHDVKFQTQSAEEKEAWMKALSDCISRAKNKVFDEVKVDESINLEHVTRTRPKGNCNRRPPTRIHMKEVADVSCDGILRLDLDLEDAVMPNGTHRANTDGTETTKGAQTDAGKVSGNPLVPVVEEDAQAEPEAPTQKKAIKPPMPPTKEAKSKSASEDEPVTNDGLEKKVPVPPLKEAKPSEEAANDQRAGVKKKAGPPPPTPPNKPSTSSSLSNLTEISPSMPNSHPPTPPAKEKKPLKTAAELDQQVQAAADEKKEKEEDSGSETTEPAVETDELNSDKVEDDQLESAAAKEKVSDEETPEAVSCGIIKTSDNDQQEPAAPQGKSLSPPLISKKSSEDHVPPATQNKTDPSAITKPDAPSVVVSCNDPLTDSLSLLCHLSGEKKKKKKAEEKSVDSGQHSDDESEGSGCEDSLAASTAALRGSNVALDVLDASDDSIQVSVNLRPSAELQVRPNAFPCRRSQPLQKPPKPLNKPRSASIGDLLSEPSDCSQKQRGRAADKNTPALKDDVTNLEIEVALEMEKTSELLSKAQGESCGEDVPEDLLAKALEKLKKADKVLREVNKLKLTKNTIDRMSW